MYFNNQGPSWQSQVAGQQTANQAEFGATGTRTSVKVHHQPGGASNFSLSHAQPENPRDTRTNVMASGPVFGSSVQVDDRFHQATGAKNKSQIDFGYEQPQFQASSSNYGQTALGVHEVEDPRFPRKKAYQNQGTAAGVLPQHEEFGMTGGVKRINKAHQSTYDFTRGEEVKTGYGGSGAMRDAYLRERENDRFQHEQPQRLGNGYGESRQQFRELPQEDNSWQKPKKSQKAHYDQNAFVPQMGRFGEEPSYQQQQYQESYHQQDRFGGAQHDQGYGGGYQQQQPSYMQDPYAQQQQAQMAREARPAAGPGAFTSVKYSGNPPGGKSSITF